MPSWDIEVRVKWWEINDMDNVAGPKRGYNKQLAKAISEDYYNNIDIRNKWNEYFEPIAREFGIKLENWFEEI